MPAGATSKRRASSKAQCRSSEDPSGVKKISLSHCGSVIDSGRCRWCDHHPSKRRRVLVTVCVTMFGTMLAAGALGFTTLSGQLLDVQERIGDMQEEIGGRRE